MTNLIPINTLVVHEPTGATGVVKSQDSEGNVECVVITFPLNFVAPEIPGTEWPPGPGEVAHWKRDDLLTIRDKRCPHCYGTGYVVER